jgi:hypothetical protein
MTRPFHSLGKNRIGSTAAEFALVLPLLLVLIFGLIDAGRFMWTNNRAEKATQMGARFAIVTDIVPAGLVGYSFVGSTTSGGTTLTQGDVINDSSLFGGATCSSSTDALQASAVSCSCTGTCPNLGTASVGAFNNILTRMQAFMPELKANQVQIDYAFSGLGYAGDPNGIDVAPLVKVGLRNVTFSPGFLPGIAITLPPFSAEATLEDGSGTTTPN